MEGENKKNEVWLDVGKKKGRQNKKKIIQSKWAQKLNKIQKRKKIFKLIN